MGCAALAACAQTPRPLPSDLVGSFSHGAFDLALTLQLDADGSYRETSSGPLVVLRPDGTRPPAPVIDQGRYAIHGDRLDLRPRKGERRELRILKDGGLRLEEHRRRGVIIYVPDNARPAGDGLLTPKNSSP